MGSGPFTAEQVAKGLLLRPDSGTHGAVEPDRHVALSEYEDALAATRDQWVIDEI